MPLVRVFCPVCNGASADYRLPPCDYCLNQGHLDMDPNPDGTPPATHRGGEPVVLWVDRELPPVPDNPYKLTYEAKAKGR